MKNVMKYLWIAMIFMMAVSACQIQEVTPPATETPVALETEPVEPETTEIVPVVPTEELPLVGEDGNMSCTLVGPLFAELTEEQKAQLAIFPEVSGDDWTKGPEDAILTVMEYTDFFCPYCGMAYAELETLIEKYPDDVRLVYRPLPLDSLHPTAPLAAYAAESAGMQGKFWEMYDAIFLNREVLSSLTAEEFTEWLKTTAADIGMDVDQFAADIASEDVINKITTAQQTMFEAGVSSTPTVLVNGRPVGNWQSAYLSNFIEVMKAEKDMVTECPPFVIDQDKEYTATITTEKGDLVLELYPEAAPLAVNSFVYLAREGFYNDVTFHRVYHNFMAQTGDPTGTGWSGAGYQYREEIVPELTYDEAYMVGVARGQAEGSSGSQFFITYVPYPSLNGGYTIFGKLIDGIDVFEQITERDADNNPDAPEGDKIISIEIIEK
ncbi:MAG: thioredoxin domain-containing protein [Chloroflexi bacterium]|nr:thioredoxin domain-containing protein [Chloroflexota bacterium]